MFNLTLFPSSNFGPYASQAEHCMEDLNDQNEQTSSIRKLTQENITDEDLTLSTLTIKKINEPSSSCRQNALGPIKPPKTLQYLSNTQLSSSVNNTVQSPNTPDVLVQIRNLIDRQISTTVVSTDISAIDEEISIENVPWTPISPTECSSDYKSSWPITAMTSPNISSRTHLRNLFLQHQQQTLDTDSLLWSTGLETLTSNSELSNSPIEHNSEWQQESLSIVPTSEPSRNPVNNSLLIFLSVSEGFTDNIPSTSRRINENDNLFLNPIDDNDIEQDSSLLWSPEIPVDENNDAQNRSRWDFAQ